MENISNRENKLLNKEMETIVKRPKPRILVPQLAEMIISSMDEMYNKGACEDERLYHYKRVLVNFLFGKVALDLEECDFFSLLEENEALILFTFYVSENKQFDFEWSYLLSKIENIKSFMKDFKKYIVFVCRDISEVINLVPFEDDVVFLIDNCLKIIYNYNDNKISAEILMSEFQRILKCKKDYYSVIIQYKFKGVFLLNRPQNIPVNVASKKICSFMGFEQ